jgi:hypothetical protein
MRLAVGLLPLVLLVASPSPAGAGNFPTRQGEAGLLDVPTAEVIERSTAMLGFELGWDHAPGTPDRFGPLPLSLGVGLGRLELGVSARESGFPGDPRPAPMLFGTALKLSVLASSGWRPGLAVDGYLDRFNDNGVGGGRLILSTGQVGAVKLAGYAGYETQASGRSGLAAGLAAQVRHRSGLEAVLEAVRNPRGNLLGFAVRWDVSPRVGLSLGASYLPDEQGVRFAVGFGFHGVPLRRGPAAAPPPVEQPVVVQEEAAPRLAFGDRPMFKLKIRTADPSRLGEPRHTQYAPYTPPSLAGVKLAPPPRVAAPSADDVLAAQLRDQELLAEARLKRLRATDDSLDTDEGNLDADARKLDERERVLAAREAQLDARERRIVVRGAPTEPQRQLESQEAQLGAAERQLAAQERGFNPTREAALGTERDAQAREQAERKEADRLLAQADTEKTKARQGELRRQALAARQRMLAAMESRLVARGERVDAATRQLRVRAERADTWQRRLDVRAERLTLLEQRAAEQQRGAAAAAPAPGLPLPPVPTDKSVFVMVVKSPTAIMKAGGGTAGPGSAQRDPLHPGFAVEKAVAASTVIGFATPTSKLSELDRETIDSIARLAARENCEVLVWARAKDPGLMNEANRRAQEVKALIVGLGRLPPNQVVTRTTTRPSAQGVDVVVSALRESGKPRADAGGEVASGDKLGGGETAKRQIRDAVVAVQPAIERCVAEQMARRGLTSAEGSLKLTVSPAGRVTGAQAGSGDLGGGELEACLKAASTAWQFPSAETEYVVDVPITVVGAGAKP